MRITAARRAARNTIPITRISYCPLIANTQRPQATLHTRIDAKLLQDRRWLLRDEIAYDARSEIEEQERDHLLTIVELLLAPRRDTPANIVLHLAEDVRVTECDATTLLICRGADGRVESKDLGHIALGFVD